MRLIKGAKKDDDDPEKKRQEWLKDLGFEESYQDADADRKEKPAEDYTELLRERLEHIKGLEVDDRQRVQWEAQSRGLPFVDLDRISVERASLGCISGDLAREHQVLPVKREGQNLWLAMADPKDIAAIDAVRDASQCRVYPVVAVGAAVVAAIEKYYPPGND